MEEKMSTFEQLYRAVATKTGITISQSKQIVEEVFESTKEILKYRNELKVPNFGTFKVKESKATQRVNPKTQEKISVPAKKRISFKKSKKFKN